MNPGDQRAAERFVCIHGHFYQPPRENAWLEAVQLQDSAYPYHDWNERINEECYAPNAAARILGSKGRIVAISNNYSKISFNFGPTLLHWLQTADPATYAAILAADRLSRERFNGHGSAMAQAYSHMILPLANDRDVRTQLRWGIADFRARFERPPEGLWLPETAVDSRTLRMMVEEGIAFTVLAPHQARRFRSGPGQDWQETAGADIDSTRPYRVHTSSGDITVFFYDGPTSRAVAFEGLLDNGGALAERLTAIFNGSYSGDALSTIAVDGETFGHHHPFGEMALAYALHQIEHQGAARLTCYGAYLAEHPAVWEAEIEENTSWSCAHGIERWRADCGCNSGSKPGWQQGWRAPLRASLDWLRDEVSWRFEELGAQLLKDPWGARDAYIDVILERTEERRNAFLQQHALFTLERLERWQQVQVWKLLELQRHAMLMYTSCGFFFDDLSGIETVQVLQYAARVVQLATELFGADLEAGFLRRLDEAHSNLPGAPGGAEIFARQVRPSMVDLAAVGAHYAVMSLFQPVEERARVYGYRAERHALHVYSVGAAHLSVGDVSIRSEITLEESMLHFGAVHLGDHNLAAGVCDARDLLSSQVDQELTAAFEQAELAEVVRLLDRHYEVNYSFRHLFRDEQRTLLEHILGAARTQAEQSYRHVYEHHAPLMRFMVDLGVPLPPVFAMGGQFVLNQALRRSIELSPPDLERARALVEEMRLLGMSFDEKTLSFSLEHALAEGARPLLPQPPDVGTIEQLTSLAAFAREMPFAVDLWQPQNVCYRLMVDQLPEWRRRAAEGEGPAAAMVEALERLGDLLDVAPQ